VLQAGISTHGLHADDLDVRHTVALQRELHRESDEEPARHDVAAVRHDLQR
jgi:hypothetical protein